MSTMQVILTQTDAPRLETGQAHLYAVDLDEMQPSSALLEQLLSRDERKRAEFYRIPLERRRYATGRAILRTILARYVPYTAEELRFDYGLHGKPSLSYQFNLDHLEFNLSRSHGQALYAISKLGPVGVDIQKVEFTQQSMQIAQRVFSAEQVGQLRQANPSQRGELFCNWWTRGEAVAKATGAGISTMADQHPERWWVTTLLPSRGFVGAIAFHRKPDYVRWLSSDLSCVIRPRDGQLM